MKKTLLAIIPALLVLSSCGPANLAKDLKEANDGPIFVEDTLAHEDIFGDVDFHYMGVRKAYTNPEEGETVLGIQTKEDSTYISIRFVAAVKLTGEQTFADIDATWTRAMFDEGGVSVKASADKPCHKGYTTLTDGTATKNIAEIDGYNFFVVYSMLNIPKAANASSYLSAYVTINGVQSKVVVTSVDQSKQFAYTYNQGAYFLSGRIGGADDQFVRASSIRSGGNVAAFEYIDFAEGDSFVLNEFYGNALYVKDSDMLTYDGDSNIKRCFEADASKNINLKSGMAGNYGLYVEDSSGFRLKTEGGAPYDVPNGYYVKGGMNSWGLSDPMYSTRDDNKAKSHKVTFEAGQEFKVWQDTGGDGTWHGWPNEKVSSDASLFTGTGGGSNIKCVNGGDFVIYLNKDNKIWVEPWVEPAP